MFISPKVHRTKGDKHILNLKSDKTVYLGQNPVILGLLCDIDKIHRYT